MIGFDTIEERTRKIRRKFEQRKTYPYGNGSSWKDFLAHLEGKKGLFMLVVERELSHQEVAFEPHRERLFGVYADRTDGKLGRICFGWATPYFGGAEKAYEEIFTVDGYDPKFLNTRDYTTENLHLPTIHCKIVEVIDNQAAVAEEVAKLAGRFISPGIPIKEQAAVLASIACVISGVPREWKHPLIKGAAKEVVAKIQERWNFLEEENEGLKEAIKENEHEMDLLNGFDLE